MNRLEKELSGKLQIIRVNVQDEVGQKLGQRFGCRFTPTFILFDRNGIEKWRSVGTLDVERVKASVGQEGDIAR